MQVGQGNITGHQKATPDQRADSLQNDSELVNGKRWRKAHPNTVPQLAPGNLRSPSSNRPGRLTRTGTDPGLWALPQFMVQPGRPLEEALYQQIEFPIHTRS